MKLALVTHAEHPKLRGTLPDIWPEFMAHDPVVQSFWPQLYDQYPDFQIWVVDREVGRRATVGYACSVPVGWNGDPSPRGIDWALTDGVEGTPTTLCAIVAGVVPDYRGFGIAGTILRRLAAIGAGHGHSGHRVLGMMQMLAPMRDDDHPFLRLRRRQRQQRRR